ncbi:MAG: hypothetical protein FWE10_00915 [Rikenellaceae bacterium]|nr:hypothetical protein [Rikenellaceae bacterium]MCL2692297.1 hypothetical protein [Rikenellaceae bacterium]
MPENKDYTSSSFRITFLVIAILLVVSLIPPFSIGGIQFKRANILSDVIEFSDTTSDRDGGLTKLDLHFLEEAERRGYLDDTEGVEASEDSALGDAAITDTPPRHEQSIQQHVERSAEQTVERREVRNNVRTGDGIVHFIDYTPDGRVSVADFVRTMEQASGSRVVRIAFFGDSYIEGDIITADIREQLQSKYGGEGVGFVPLGNPLAISRPSITHTFGGWTNHNLIYKRNAPDELQNMFFVSGIVSTPNEPEAWTTYKGTRFRRHIGSWSRARLIFVNDGDTTIDITVNDTVSRSFTPERGAQVQQIHLADQRAGSLDVRVKSHFDDDRFIGYGVVLDGRVGVAVDNYAIRSNSGIAFFGTDREVNTQIGRMLGYDLVVLQWGLNAMSPDVTNYSSYGTSLRRVINYVKSCFPNSAIVVIGVGDRSTQRDGQFVTMDAVGAMRAEQKAAAEACGVAWWDTFEAMGGDGSMVEFVERQWAAKDYMHLSYGGGRHIATRFVEALAALRE